MRKKSFKKNLIQTGKLLKKLPLLWVTGFVGTFSLALLVQIFGASKLNLFSAVTLTFIFILGTGFFSLLIQVLILGLGEILVWLGNRKTKINTSNIDFDIQIDYPKNKKRQFFLEVKNNKSWFTAKEVYVFWEDFSASISVDNSVFLSYKIWNKYTTWNNNGFLKWKNENAFITSIGRNRGKDAFLFELDVENNRFCIQTLNREPFCFPQGSYRLYLNVHAKIPKRYSSFVIYVDVEYLGEGNLEIKSVGRKPAI